MGPLVVFLLGAGTALFGGETIKKGLKGAVRQAVKARIELEQTVASVREDLEDMAASVREEKKADNGQAKMS